MESFDRLPLPDWGLKCLGCGRPARHRPVADLGRPSCRYSLTGLLGERCPECGHAFELRQLLARISLRQGHLPARVEHCSDHHLKRREPVLTGHEQPLPDFGLFCDGWPLADAPSNACPHCGREFDLSLLTPISGDWIDFEPFIPRHLAWVAGPVLYAGGIPYLVAQTPPIASPAITSIDPRRIRIPREFLFHALYHLAEAARPQFDVPQQAWVCRCGEKVPTGFEVCWKCGRAHPKLEDPTRASGGAS
ncbi:MAG TPA: hypothetical protein PLV57_04245 [Phycisphaerae bacterium]|nr:hypothetical protein [Phycisphaerae bacterium]HOM51065.1 hypothetical protein [Phycisphaerae bacterium]HON66161.1 hypothetical protein [Phycisphaerae bacterium]HPP25706.1 hypothetical protein [Phycisphaerae bacterium]HPZ96871.1 hypothetical protein [Phycisphaerae bacterium]